MKRLLAACALTIGLLTVGANPALACCGDTPGFCPNPPESGWVVGAGGDWGQQPSPPLPF